MVFNIKTLPVNFLGRYLRWRLQKPPWRFPCNTWFCCRVTGSSRCGREFLFRDLERLLLMEDLPWKVALLQGFIWCSYLIFTWCSYYFSHDFIYLQVKSLENLVFLHQERNVWRWDFRQPTLTVGTFDCWKGRARRGQTGKPGEWPKVPRRWTYTARRSWNKWSFTWVAQPPINGRK